MTTHEFALSDLAARLLGTDASLSTSLRDILTVALQELIEAELTATINSEPIPALRSNCRTAAKRTSADLRYRYGFVALLDDGWSAMLVE